MLVTLCQLLVVLFSLFRVVWDFLVGCLGFFTEGSVLYPLMVCICAMRCLSLFTCQRFKGSLELLFHTVPQEGVDGLRGWRRRKDKWKEINTWVNYHVLSVLDSLQR